MEFIDLRSKPHRRYNPERPNEKFTTRYRIEIYTKSGYVIGHDFFSFPSDLVEEYKGERREEYGLSKVVVYHDPLPETDEQNSTPPKPTLYRVYWK